MVDVLIIEPMYAEVDAGETLIRKEAVFTSGSPVYLREPIAAEYIAGYLNFKGISANIIQQTSTDNNQVFDKITEEKPKILGISIHSTHMVPDALTLVNEIKDKFQDLIIVCGGGHVTGSPEMIKEKNIDYAVIGEGEEALYKLSLLILKDNGTKKENIEGLIYKDLENNVHKVPPKRFDFTQKFLPIRQRDILERVKSAPLSYPTPLEQKGVAQVAYSRGCCYHCEFCVSPIVFPGKVIWRDPDDVVKELEGLKKEFKTNFVFFNDLTFNHSIKKAEALCNRLIEADLGINWFAYTNVHLKESLVKKMAVAGCTRIGMRAESLTDTILKNMKPQQHFANIRNSLELTNKYGILTRVYFMLGSPEETKENLSETLQIMKTLPIDQPRLAFITSFPGTKFYEETKDKLTTNDLRMFSGDSPVVRNPNISPAEYINIRDEMLKSYYSSDEYFSHVMGKIKDHPHLNRSFDYFFKYLLDKKIIEDKTYSRAVDGLDVQKVSITGFSTIKRGDITLKTEPTKKKV